MRISSKAFRGYLGEGFHDSRLDTLFLTMPISWKGTLAQYVGRLHREHQDKNEVLVYDYTDSAVPVLARMATRRGAGYRALGYVVTLSPTHSRPSKTWGDCQPSVRGSRPGSGPGRPDDRRCDDLPALISPQVLDGLIRQIRAFRAFWPLSVCSRGTRRARPWLNDQRRTPLPPSLGLAAACLGTPLGFPITNPTDGANFAPDDAANRIETATPDRDTAVVPR